MQQYNSFDKTIEKQIDCIKFDGHFGLIPFNLKVQTD